MNGGPIRRSADRPLRETMGGLAKGLRIIESFSATQPRLSISDAARLSDTTPSAARRCLLTLQEAGLVTFDGKYFHPTPRMSRLGLGYMGTPLPMLAQPHLNAVRDKVGKSTSLAVLDRGYACFIARAETEHLVTAAVRVGSRLPAQTSSNGRVLLAALDDAQLETFLRAMPPPPAGTNIVSDSAAVRARVLEARRCGHSYSDEELEYGVRTLAVPVRDAGGVLRAAMSVSAFAHQTTVEDLINNNLNVLQTAAHALGASL